MMQVYIVSYVSWEESFIDTVWSTPEQAEERIKQVQGASEDIRSPHGYAMEIWEVDKI